MLRYEKFENFTDGRRYTAEDIVAVGTHGCKGCSKCCESDMGNTIVLTPYDIYNLTIATDKSFDELLTSFFIALSMIDGIVLPHLKMDSGCGFLKDGRCKVHERRPGICRLFPLGRIYEDKSFSYFLQINECPVQNKEDVKVSDWLGIPELDRNTAFINKWHRFIIYEKKKVNTIREMASNLAGRVKDMSDQDLETFVQVTGDSEIYETFVDSSKTPEMIIREYREYKTAEIMDKAEENIKNVMKTVLAILYLDRYDKDSDFYEEFDKRLKKCLGALREIV